MRKRLEKPPRYVYSIFGETGEKKEPWFALSFSTEEAAITMANTLNTLLRRVESHYDNYNELRFHTPEELRAVDKAAPELKRDGARYSMIRYLYQDAKDKGRLPPGVK